MFSSCYSTSGHPNTSVPNTPKQVLPGHLQGPGEKLVLPLAESLIKTPSPVWNCHHDVTLGIFVLLVTNLFSTAHSPPPHTHSRKKNSLPVNSHSYVISDPSHTPPPACYQHSQIRFLRERVNPTAFFSFPHLNPLKLGSPRSSLSPCLGSGRLGWVSVKE